MGAKAQMFQSNLSVQGSNKNCGTIIVRAEAVQGGSVCARFKFSWQNLNNMSAGFIGIGRKRMGVKFEIGRQIPGTDKFAEIFASQIIKQKDGDYHLPLQSISLQKLCNNNRDAKIRFSVWDRREKLLNDVQFTINQAEN